MNTYSFLKKDNIWRKEELLKYLSTRNQTIKRLEKLKRRVIFANILPLQKPLEIQALHISDKLLFCYLRAIARDNLYNICRIWGIYGAFERLLG